MTITISKFAFDISIFSSLARIKKNIIPITSIIETGEIIIKKKLKKENKYNI